MLQVDVLHLRECIPVHRATPPRRSLVQAAHRVLSRWGHVLSLVDVVLYSFMLLHLLAKLSLLHTSPHSIQFAFRARPRNGCSWWEQWPGHSGTQAHMPVASVAGLRAHESCLL